MILFIEYIFHVSLRCNSMLYRGNFSSVTKITFSSEDKINFFGAPQDVTVSLVPSLFHKLIEIRKP